MTFAHQGGWDEILLVLAPIALFAALLYVANKRAERLGDGEADGGDELGDVGRLPTPERPDDRT